jgi:cation-transporting ATPase E
VTPGLSDAEVAARHRDGRGNAVADRPSRTVGEILRANVLTRFNAILGALFVVIVVVGPVQDGLFGIVVVANAAIGAAQEVRAKRTLDRLALVATGRCVVRRAGETRRVPPGDLVLGDLLLLGPGDQLVVDARTLEASGLEIDESLLSGESLPVAKQAGDLLLSGSFVAAGSGSAEVTAVGDASFARRLTTEARRFAPARSELTTGIDQVLRVVTWLIVPAAAVLFTNQLRTSHHLEDALRGAVAGVVGMVPEGLVLLTSVASAVGIVRLARRRVLVQELGALEGLARVDVLCIDKTGTLTTGDLRVVAGEPLAGGLRDDAVAALAAADPSPNQTMRALAQAGPVDATWSATATVPFSSARKWSGATFDGHGTWVLGAPDVLLDDDDPVVARGRVLAAGGRRVLLLARAPHLDGDRLPNPLEPVQLVVMEEQLRSDAEATLAWFAEQDVRVLVLSGDHPATAAAVARAVGLTSAAPPLDARELPTDPDALADAVAQVGVVGRVTPEQKRAVVRALQGRGHVVAMTGDGVNDVLALKAADLGVAMGSGTPAGRAVARVVLLDDRFAALPAVVAEGRRLIANVERVTTLFLTKTVYAFLLAVSVGVVGLPFPFLPRHLTIVSTLTIGVPAFVLALAPTADRSRSGFVRRALHLALPSGVVAAAATFIAYAIVLRGLDVSHAEARTVATLVLFTVAVEVLLLIARPRSAGNLLLVGAMVVGFGVALVDPSLRRFFALVVPGPGSVAVAVVIAAVASAALGAGWRWGQRTA